jgi:hypothetical protein
MTNLTHFSQCIYFMPLHVSSNKCSSSGGPTCVNTSSGITQCSEWLTCRSGVSSWPACQTVTHYSVLYQMMYWHKLALLMMSTCCSKYVEAWNKYIEKVCVKMVINQNGIACLLPFSHCESFVAHSRQHMWGAQDLSRSPILPPKYKWYAFFTIAVMDFLCLPNVTSPQM